MKCLIVLFAAAAVASAQFVPLTPGLRTQYHAQNELGAYSFGYSGGPSSKQESSAAGITHGAFSYLDAHGLVQSRSYVSDGLGFRVAGTDIPVDANTPLAVSPVAVAPVAPLAHPAVILARKRRQAVYIPHAYPYAAITPVVAHGHPLDTPEVAAAKINHFHQYNYEAVRNAHLSGRKKRSVYSYAAPVPLAYHAAPVALAYHAAPAVHPIPAAVSSQFHAQDELGQYTYGYNTPLSSKTETRHANGVTQGGYSYVDAHGLVQSANYVSDPAHGFRVAATNIPVAPVA